MIDGSAARRASPWSSARSSWCGAPPAAAKEQAAEKADATSWSPPRTSAGVAPGLTVEWPSRSTGRSAPQICDVLEDGVSSAESLLLTGNPSGRREKLITTDAVTYERLVVKTYCPDELSTFDDLVADIDPTETTS